MVLPTFSPWGCPPHSQKVGKTTADAIKQSKQFKEFKRFKGSTGTPSRLQLKEKKKTESMPPAPWVSLDPLNSLNSSNSLNYFTSFDCLFASAVVFPTFSQVGVPPTAKKLEKPRPKQLNNQHNLNN